MVEVRRIPLANAMVELEVSDGKSKVYIDSIPFDVPSEVASRLIFGPRPARRGKPGPKPKAAQAEAKVKKGGCQSLSSRKKLSASLRKFHAKKRRKLSKSLEASPQKKHLNGASLHVN